MDYRLTTNVLPDLLPSVNRTKGSHVGSLVYRLCKSLGHFDEWKADGPSEPSPNTLTRMRLGLAFEHAIAHRLHLHHPHQHLQVGEIFKDNIYGHPDLIDVSTSPNIVEEIKFTWLSSRNDIESEKYFKYLCQLKAYCWMWETTRGRLITCHVNGDYRSSGPVYREWDIEFSMTELAENWVMLKSMVERTEEYDS